MNNDDATQFSYFRDNELTQLVDMSVNDEESNSTKALAEGSDFLNKYKILKVLGEGSFSLIYLLEAKDVSKKLLVAKEFFPKGFVTRNLNNEVVLKTSLTDKEIENYHFMKDIFIGEAQNLVKVSKRTHPNVLNFFALEEDINNTMYLITDYEEGMTLKEYVKERKNEHKGKLTNQEIKGIVSGLLDGLGHIHKVSVYHQDIKLENILIRQDQQPLLLDFGASIILYDEKQKKYFNATTPRYAAPEQVNLGQPPKIDQRTDIYELGVLMYKLITDEFPPKASERIKAEEEYKDSYVSLEIQKPYGYDLTVLKAVDKALQLRVEDRFQNSEDFKKAILVKKSYMNTLIVMIGVFVPLLLGFIYLLWPTSEGIAKLNLEQKQYLVYSDGKKITLSEEKTIVLPEGKHQLTIIKDGYIPNEINVTIQANNIVNIYGKLSPVKHKILLKSNIDSAVFTVNGKRLIEPIFVGQAGNIYTIKTTAENYTTSIEEVKYTALLKNNFNFNQELQPIETEVNIGIEAPLTLGQTSIRVNGKILNDTILIAKYNKSYTIDINNEYYEAVHLERTYNELTQNTEQKIVLHQGEGEIILEGLPSGATIEVYQKSIDETKPIKSQFKYTNHVYKGKIPAFDKIYIKISKEGYETLETPIIDIKHNAKYIEKYELNKKVIKIDKSIVKKEENKPVDNTENMAIILNNKEIKLPKQIDIEADKKIIVIPNTEKIITKVETNNTQNIVTIVKKVLVVKKKDVIKKVEIKKSKNKKIKTVKYRIKKGDTISSIARSKHTTVKEVRKQNNLKKGYILKLGRILEIPINTYYSKVKIVKKKVIKKRKTKKLKKVKKRRQKKVQSNYQWYCVAGGNSSKTWSAKSSTRKGAYASALRQCRRRKNNFCRVSSCYILGG